MKITIAGIGYVGLSLAALLGRKHRIVAFDIDDKKVERINKQAPRTEDKQIQELFGSKKLHVFATTDYREAFLEADYIVICTPTNYDEEKKKFDTKSVEDVIKKAFSVNKTATIVIKSTVPVGFTKKMRRKYRTRRILFSPEFLREGHALFDNLYPARIVVGSKSEAGKEFAKILKEVALNKPEVLLMSSDAAEAVKLFSNTYLALRIAFFNELDTYAEIKKINVRDIIKGVCLDPRIGDYYNNPSFGYGGYCLPKDTKQVVANFDGVPQDIMSAIVKSNETRKKHITKMIMKRNPRVVGVYRLSMKSGTGDSRDAAVYDIIRILVENGVKVVVYEPTLKVDEYNGLKVIKDLEEFKKCSDVIIANRMEKELEKHGSTIYTKDIFGRD